jgi:hypothetical protein
MDQSLQQGDVNSRQWQIFAGCGSGSLHIFTNNTPSWKQIVVQHFIYSLTRCEYLYGIRTSVFRIHDILVWIRMWIRGSMPLTNGSGSGCGYVSCYFCQWPSRGQRKLILFKKFFCLLLFEGTFTSLFKDKKSKKSHKIVEINVFPTIFAWW